MKLLEVYKFGFLSIFKIIVLVISELVCLITLVVTMPLWWLKYVQNLLSTLSNLIEKVLNW